MPVEHQSEGFEAARDVLGGFGPVAPDEQDAVACPGSEPPRPIRDLLGLRPSVEVGRVDGDRISPNPGPASVVIDDAGAPVHRRSCVLTTFEEALDPWRN